jgi:hypothetical protein
MAEDSIRRLFFAPPTAIARLGGSTTPLEAFDWVVGDPHTIAETRVRPTWTLDVDQEGAVTPRMPTPRWSAMGRWCAPSRRSSNCGR